MIQVSESSLKKLNDLKDSLNLTKLELENQNISELMLSDTFWDDVKKAESLVAKQNENKYKIETYNKLASSISSFRQGLIDLKSNYDEEMHLLYEEEYHNLIKQIDRFEIECLLNDEYDSLDAIIDIHPGAGGTESQDWANMLYGMYVRFAENNKFKIETLDLEQALDAGIKSVSFVIRGKNAFGLLKGERGVHRLVRISPFDANARRHTSFASVDVVPEFNNDESIIINESDLKIDTYRASGAGGQHINKTDSAVRITHLPTGIVVSCQNQRSQIQNKEKCLMTLKAKLYQKALIEQQNKLNDIRGELKSIEWGSQIRSYVFCPYTLVKDNRSNYETSNVEGIMNGNINEMIFAYLKSIKK